MTSSSRRKTSNGLQGDLLSRQWLSKPPKRGGGKHVRLMPLNNIPQVAVPGMASFADGGPPGTLCRDCSHFADELAVQTGADSIEKARGGCVLWARRMAHAAPSARLDIRLCRSCKHFEAADAAPPFVVIDVRGEVHRLTGMPENLKSWLRNRS